MSNFNLAIACLTASNLSWFMDLTFQVPMQCCSLQHWTLLPLPDTSTTRHRFLFGSASSFFLELFLCSSPVANWTPTDLGIFQCTSFCPFILCMGFSRQEYWSDLPFLSPVNCFVRPQQAGTCPAGWHAWCPGCSTAGPLWACKLSLTVECQLACCLGAKAKAFLESPGRGSWEGWSRCWRTPRRGGPLGLSAASGRPGADPLYIW